MVDFSENDFSDIFEKTYQDNCSVNWLKKHPEAVAANIKQFIFHDDMYKDMDEKMQATLNACMFII